ncbi:MAG: nitroreductase family protein [Lachnospiraceae bacterium]|nr:nitroreductase family protein [Lachnospiraceae bacterium]
MVDFYEMIYKRKSFHLFRNIGDEKLTENDLQDIRTTYEKIEALYSDIKTDIRIVSSDEKVLGRGAEHAIEIYSEKKDNYLMNAGYIGEMLDLYLVSKNIGTLWFGIGKPEEKEYNGLSFVIMILIAKVDSPEKFRKDMFKSKRKLLGEIWEGEQIPGVSEIVRFAPSACNSQPWFVKREENILKVYRYRKSGRIGIMPSDMVSVMNRIDMGIFIRFLELCLQHENYEFSRELFVDEGSDRELTINAQFVL